MSVKLSERLKAAYDMVTEGSVVADVGCDHAFLSIALCEILRLHCVSLRMTFQIYAELYCHPEWSEAQSKDLMPFFLQVLLALPLGELSAKLTERALMASPSVGKLSALCRLMRGREALYR